MKKKANKKNKKVQEKRGWRKKGCVNKGPHHFTQVPTEQPDNITLRPTLPETNRFNFPGHQENLRY